MGGAGCGLSVWRVGRDRGEAESHSRAEDNVVGWRRGGEGRSVRCGACAGGVRTGWVCVCVCVCVCAYKCIESVSLTNLRYFIPKMKYSEY